MRMDAFGCPAAGKFLASSKNAQSLSPGFCQALMSGLLCTPTIRLNQIFLIYFLLFD